ncbi:MAG: hypothetical protein AVDCRST_MAG67-900 [uncultured Solirubrobacteraceae bacterium]|uniref:Uncharacterized protein n=1 Tax=uncultured Solirubrobacteraceae bacterium TaxID=1162706 RepID=A0A6J4RT49_9ACTN|nr:MAG: hypothetical protein AVDCRST_MAG67-900 [uncultured Solirubrobacteraceae bacterium]
MQRWEISRGRHAVFALAMTVATLAALAPSSLAIVPPSDCGTLTVKAKRYNIKADQLRCATARSHAKRYLSSQIKPSGYRCRNFGAETKLKFRCSRSAKVFFAIRR